MKSFKKVEKILKVLKEFAQCFRIGVFRAGLDADQRGENTVLERLLRFEKYFTK